ncbi:ABC transporter substrate-binding protein [Agrobacterium sp. FDAARGOS_525]|uniref:ABC transporter substrate-binding protein n=1 Tax=Agrobacterium sp. FDAARGOS_525 TaxID=2420311 RepID=UPI00256EF511|nr:ABC transporter substrate-binding protein [Agrobacterium sp. FDAARGOS_525]
MSADQKVYTFKLADTKWHDGKPFTSKDVKFTIELAKNEKAGSVFAARLGAIEASRPQTTAPWWSSSRQRRRACSTHLPR